MSLFSWLRDRVKASVLQGVQGVQDALDALNARGRAAGGAATGRRRRIDGGVRGDERPRAAAGSEGTVSEHTPGPWRHNQEQICAGAILPAIRTPGSFFVAVVHARDDGDEFLANVALVAAAPDLLAACEAALPILHAYIPPDQFDGHASHALVMVKDAVARARRPAAKQLPGVRIAGRM